MIDMVGTQDVHKLRVAYLLQNTGINFSEPYAAQLHILHTLYGLQERGHHASLLALQPQRRVLYTDDLEAVTSGRLTEKHYGSIGRSDGRGFKLFESGVRKLQNSLNFPYLALFDDLRMYEAALNNLRNYQLIHERFSGSVIGGALASEKLGIPFILEVNADLFDQSIAQGVPIKGLQHLAAMKKTRHSFYRADKIICVSEELRFHLIDKWSLPPEKTVTLACAADVETFGQDYDTRVIREELNLTYEPIVMWIGGFHRWHDLDLLLESFTKVVAVVPLAKLVMVGDGKNRVDFERKITQAGLDRSVSMVGAIEHAKVPKVLSIADVAVAPAPLLPAREGGTGTPLKLFEYMAAGKAIVASNTSQSAPVIQDGFNGILVEPGDVDGFAKAIIKLLNDDELRNLLGLNARQQAVDQHSWDHYAKLLENIYVDVLQKQV